MPENCSREADRECQGVRRAEEVAGSVKELESRLNEFRQAVSDTNSRFGGRIGKLEAHNDVQDEQLRQIKEAQLEIKAEIREAQKEQKDSLAELRMEHKESMAELKKSNKDILDAVTPLKHKVESLENLEKEVHEIKAKPGETWEHIKKQGLGWAVAIVLALIAAALGLSQFA